jgi:hypothetical protein
MPCAVVLSHHPREAWSEVDNGLFVFNLNGHGLHLRHELAPWAQSHVTATV